MKKIIFALLSTVTLFSHASFAAHLVETTKYYAEYKHDLDNYYGEPSVYAHSMAVANNSIYVSGEWRASFLHKTTVTSMQLGAYWVNGKQFLIDSKDPVEKWVVASDIAIDRNDIYLAGSAGFYGGPAAGPFHAKAWKNGKELPLQIDEGKLSIANAIAVSNSTVYVVGRQGFSATMWIDGVPTQLSSDSSEVSGILTSGKDVYVTGSVNSMSSGYQQGYWKNGKFVAVQIPKQDSLSIKSISVSGDDVYLAGKQFGSNPSKGPYLKNGEIKYLSANNDVCGVNAIFADSNNVYVGGGIIGTDPSSCHAAIWINGKVIKLGVNGQPSEVQKIVKVGKFLYVLGAEVSSSIFYSGSNPVLWKISL